MGGRLEQAPETPADFAQAHFHVEVEVQMAVEFVEAGGGAGLQDGVDLVGVDFARDGHGAVHVLVDFGRPEVELGFGLARPVPGAVVRAVVGTALAAVPLLAAAGAAVCVD